MNPSDLRVGVGDARCSGQGRGVITTHALGSCLAVTFYDPDSRAGAMLHAMLPGPAQPGENATRPDIYLTSGLPRLQKSFEAAGGKMARAIVCAAGAAELIDDAAGFKIGARNWAAMRKLCFKQGIRIVAQEVGGNLTRNLSLDLATGEVVVTTGGLKKAIWSGAAMPRREAS
jgi:chemotaxis protein CheD